MNKTYDPVNHPKHYTSHPSGIECIQITEHLSFTIGNAIKYLWRADEKGGIEDLEKAVWYINREIEKRMNKVAKDLVEGAKYSQNTTNPLVDVGQAPPPFFKWKDGQEQPVYTHAQELAMKKAAWGYVNNSLEAPKQSLVLNSKKESNND